MASSISVSFAAGRTPACSRRSSGDKVVSHVHGVSVLQGGRVVESGPVREIFSRPRQPYTEALLDAIPALPR
jgi:ABC-type antimicrobial peptide transport system ATPase subunit